jgi:hypothetical protein
MAVMLPPPVVVSLAVTAENRGGDDQPFWPSGVGKRIDHGRGGVSGSGRIC